MKGSIILSLFHKPGNRSDFKVTVRGKDFDFYRLVVFLQHHAASTISCKVERDTCHKQYKKTCVYERSN